MFGRTFHDLVEVSHRDVDLVCSILQHRNRPPANRENDQIYMLAGSQMIQASLVEDLFANKRVVFMGDGDCMSLVIALLARKERIQSPSHITVLDFDRRLLKFIQSMLSVVGWHEDNFTAQFYNVREPVPDDLYRKSEVFYTNPPYGYYNRGLAGKVFLARAMDLCGNRAKGGAILPYDFNIDKSVHAMRPIQKFMIDSGYVISEMLIGQHLYDLDDRPGLYSGTVIFDQVEQLTNSFSGRSLTEKEMIGFYGRRTTSIPDEIS